MFRHIYLSNPRWWFSASDEDDAYITREFGHLLDEENTTHDDLLNLILIYDQLPRHMFRNTPSNHVISWFLQQALDLCFCLTPAYLDSLTTQEWCFAFLPYRHTNDPRYIIEVAKLAWTKIMTLTTPDDIAIMRRFLKALYERCPTEDQSVFIMSYQPTPFRKSLQCIYDDHKNILDIHENTQSNPPPPVKLSPLPHAHDMILSLSGGVDSMVCSYILSKQNITFQAVHINYGNRATADAEEAFVRDWCMYLGIPLHVRRITEIKREPCMKHNMREIYETYTRQVRLGTYDTASASTIIVLGHNKDDCFENIMTNIAGRSHFDNLTGMSHEKFYRPLLHVSKADIKAFAAQHRIPHLPNSTPTWSQRGQIRASVVPVLDAWNPLFVPGMHHLSTTLSEYHQLARHLAQIFIEQLSMDLVVNNTCFWRAVFDILTPTHHPSLKSIDNLITTVNTKTPPYTVVISKYLTMNVDKAGRIYFTHLV